MEDERRTNATSAAIAAAAVILRAAMAETWSWFEAQGGSKDMDGEMPIYRIGSFSDIC